MWLVDNNCRCQLPNQYPVLLLVIDALLFTTCLFVSTINRYYYDALMIHWWCADNAPMMNWWWADYALMMHRWYIDFTLTMRWRCTDDALMMPWWYSDDALLMYWWCTDDAQMMHWWCADDALMMHRWCAYDALMMHSWCTDDALLMHWWYTDDAQVMHWWCASVIFDILESSSFQKYSICRVFCAVWWYDDHHMIIWWSSYEDMMMMTRCQDHILTENIWFGWSRTSYSWDKWRCNRCGTDERTREDRATQPMDSWKAESRKYLGRVKMKNEKIWAEWKSKMKSFGPSENPKKLS